MSGSIDPARGEQRPTVVYTDGACRGNPGPGGWGWVVPPDGPWAAGAAPETTNNRMELQAVLAALAALEGHDPLEVVTDSNYIVNCFDQRWWVNWQRRNWRNASGKPVKNQDLWEPLIEQALARGVVFRWVKGHAGDRWNHEADRLATEAADEQKNEYVVYRLDFSGGEHYIGYTGQALPDRLRQHRRRGTHEMQRLQGNEKPRTTILHRGSSKQLAEYFEQRFIDEAMEAPTRRLLLNTVTP